jgi:transposase
MQQHLGPRRPLSVLILAQFFISLELSRSSWVITSLSPGAGRRCPSIRLRRAMSQACSSGSASSRRRRGANGQGLSDHCHPRAGLDGFLDSPSAGSQWDRKPCRRARLDRGAQATPTRQDRRDRRRDACAHTYDVQAGRARVCSMVVAPSPEEEDRRRLSRERRTLIKERIEHVNQGGLMRKDFRDRIACSNRIGKIFRATT